MMFERLLAIIVIIHSKSARCVPSFSGQTDVTESYVGSSVQLSLLYYDQATRRFHFRKKYDSISEGRNFKKKQKSTGFFNQVFNFFRSTFTGSFWFAAPKNNVLKKKPVKIYEDDDPVSNFLDDLDDMFRKPFRDPSSGESSGWFDWFDDSAEKIKPDTKYSEEYESDEAYEDVFTSSTEDEPPSSHKVMVQTKPTTPSSIQTVVTQKMTTNTPDKYASEDMYQDIFTSSTEEDNKVTTPTSVSIKNVTASKADDYTSDELYHDIFTSSTDEELTTNNVIKTKTTTPSTTTVKKAITTKQTYATTAKPKTRTTKKPTTVSFFAKPISYSQYGNNRRPTRKNSKIVHTTKRPVSSRRPNNLSKYPNVKNNRDCVDKITSQLPSPISYVVPTTQPTTGGWFNFLSGSSDNDDDDSENQVTEPSSGWFGGLFNDDTSTKAPVVNTISQLMMPTSTAIPPESTWFNTFLTLEEDDAYSANITVKEKKTRKKNYTGYQLLRIYPNTPWKVNSLQDLQEDTQGSGLMWWSSPALNRSADLLVPPDLLADIKDHLNEENMSYDVVIWDLQKAIAFENPRLSKTQRLELEVTRGHPLTWRRYHRYADILRYLEYISLKYPDLVELIPMGRSYEGLPIIAAKISIPGNETVQPNRKKWKLKSRMKPAIWIDGGSHAREWISPAVATWILHTLVEGEHGNGAEMEMLKTADWYILPVLNPDGYEYTHTHDRLWRKSRSIHADEIYFNSWFPWQWGKTECYGVDLNRNWDYHWGEKGSSNDPCSDYYAGPQPFSEPESKSTSNFIMSIKDQLKVFLTLHAYSQMWVLPTTHSREPFVDKNELMEMGRLALNALKDVSGTKYEIGTLSDLLLPITGTSYDWAKGRAGIKYSYAVKLRDSLGPYGYLLPGSQITHTAKETWEAIKTVVDNL